MKKILLFFLLSLSIISNAQNPGDIAQSFGKFPGFNNIVYAIATQTDGKLLVGGNFTTYNGVTENRIMRLNTDGTKDTSFNTGTGFNNTVRKIVVQTDGKILVGGEFSNYNGGTENYIIRLNTDGTKDTTFITGSGFNSSVLAITTQADGKILVGGLFTTYKGVTENRIIRLNTDGTKDTSFTTGTGFNNSVWAITTQADGKILLGGQFTTYKGLTENCIIRLNTDGTKDASFITGTGFNNTVYAIATQADGKILVGGFFTTYKGIAENYIIRLNTDGTKDTSFTTGTGLNITVFTITTQADGKLLVGGAFTTYNGGTENRIIRLNINGTKDTSFNTGIGFNSLVYAIATQADGKILVGGQFTTYNGGNKNYIIRLNTDGTKDTSFTTGTGFNDSVRKIATQADGKILVVGNFTTYNEGTENRIIRLNTDGTKDNSFSTGTGFNNTVYAIAVQADGKILVGGYFSTYNGVNQNYIIRLNSDGSKDSSFNTGTSFNDYVLSIFIQSDGKILVGGWFTNYNGTTANRIIRLNADGTKDSTFNTGTGFNNNGINCITSQPDGKILVGGYFTTYNGVSANMIVRLNSDGTKDTTFNTGTGFDYAVHSITVQSDGKLLVGGAFVKYNSINEKFIIRLNTDGTKDSTFNTGTGFNGDVYSISLFPNGKLLVGGYFTTYKGATENRIICLNTDGTKDATFSTGTGFNNSVSSIKILTDGKVLIGGWFTTYKDSNESAMLIGLHSEINLATENYSSTTDFSLFPNPVHDILHFQSNAFTNIIAVKIYDLQGKLVLETTNNNININNLTSGLYLAKVKTAKGEETKKFIKE